jgi:hypothetical protein
MQKQNDTAGATGLPFVRRLVRGIVEELFRKQPQWKTQALVDRVLQVHRDRGGTNAPNPSNMVWRVLNDLKNDGMVNNHAHGYWLWSPGPSQDGLATEDAEAEAAQADADDLSDEAIAELDAGLRPEKELGSGDECVYLYFNPNDRRLAELEGRDVWECKVGRTGSADAISRILGQGARTALSRLPTVGLVLRTDDSAALEHALHSSLRLLEAEVPDSPGTEWFLTSPGRVEAWYAFFQEALGALRASPTVPVEQGVAPDERAPAAPARG